MHLVQETKSLFDPNSYSYNLPEDRIAKYPLDKREASKLLFYSKGEMAHYSFPEIVDIIPSNSLLFFNNTKVIPARIIFHKESGAQIEVMLLTPMEPSSEMSVVMKSNGPVVWHCLVKNLKKWKDQTQLLLKIKDGSIQIEVYATIVDRLKGIYQIDWDDKNYTFSEIVDLAGNVPLPPYLKRDAEDSDRERYQTVYSSIQGAVAAPTAGLHFTETILEDLGSKEIKTDFVTLHVSAGTFQPIKTSDIRDHQMHAEQVVINQENIRHIIQNPDRIIAVGTTSLRTLESLYWYGVKIYFGLGPHFYIEKLFPYQQFNSQLPSVKDSMKAILNLMISEGLEEIIGETQIFIFPEYTFKICRGLITNFHMPKSTLMLLVAAFIGEDWHKVYQEALQNDYRFLSYGDTSFILR